MIFAKNCLFPSHRQFFCVRNESVKNINLIKENFRNEKNNKEVNKIYSTFNNKSGLCFLSMQVLFCLSEKTLAEEIESMMSIIFPET